MKQPVHPVHRSMKCNSTQSCSCHCVQESTGEENDDASRNVVTGLMNFVLLRNPWFLFGSHESITVKMSSLRIE
jgi:hypothetical protein